MVCRVQATRSRHPIGDTMRQLTAFVVLALAGCVHGTPVEPEDMCTAAVYLTLDTTKVVVPIDSINMHGDCGGMAFVNAPPR